MSAMTVEGLDTAVIRVPFDEQHLPGVRERQAPGWGKLDGADLVRETHLPAGTTTLRDKYVVVVGG
jgi:hypothetical protein